MKTSLKKYISHFICNVCVWEGVGDRTELQYIDPHSYGHQRCVFLVLLMLNQRPGGPLCWLSLLHLITNWSGPQTPSGVPRAPSVGWWLSLPHLVSNSSDLQLTGGPEGPFCWVVAFSTTSCLRLLWSPTQSGVPRAPSAGWWLSLPHLVLNFSDLQLTDFLSSPSYIIVQSPTQSLEWHVWSSSSGNNSHAVQRSLFSGASVYECIMGFYLVPFHQPNQPTWFLLISGHWNMSLPSGASLGNGMFGRVEGQYTTPVMG